MIDSNVLNEEPIRIGLIGTFDVENYGDCLFPDVYAHLLRQRFPNARFTLYSPFARNAKILSFDVVKALPADLAAMPFAHDVMILTGGETLAVGHAMGTHMLSANTLSHYLRMWLTPTVMNGWDETRFFAHSVGVPPSLAHLLGPTAEVLQSAERVSARDAVSADHLRSAVDVDPVFLLADLMRKSDWHSKAAAQLPAGLAPESYIVCQISPLYALGQDQAWCDQIIKTLRHTGAHALFLPICHFLHDYEYLKFARQRILQLAPDLQGRVFQMPEDLRNVKDTAALIANARGLIGSSLHAAVTAAAFAKPMAVFVGNGGEDGKHRQTFLAAGFDRGIALTIASLWETYAASENSDLQAQTVIARQRATEGFDRLARAIAAPGKKTKAVSASDIAELVRLDRSRITPLKAIRRSLRRAMRLAPRLGKKRRSISFARRLGL